MKNKSDCDEIYKDWQKQRALFYKDRFMIMLNTKIKSILFKECNKRFGRIIVVLSHLTKLALMGLDKREKYYTDNWERVMMKTLKSKSFKSKATFDGLTYNLVDNKGMVEVVEIT